MRTILMPMEGENMSLREFDYNGDFSEDGMDGWFEIYDETNHHAWIATDSPISPEDAM